MVARICSRRSSLHEAARSERAWSERRRCWRLPALACLHRRPALHVRPAAWSSVRVSTIACATSEILTVDWQRVPVGSDHLYPAICHGQPTVRGMRYPVEMLLELLSSGMSIDEIVDDYPDLERDDLLAALEFGALAAGSSRMVPLGTA